MEKIVIRKDSVQGIDSRIIDASTGNANNLPDIAKTYGKQYVVENIFEEKELTYEKLCEEYERFIRGEESDVFIWMYKMHPNYGIAIDWHICLYHYTSDICEQQDKLFPWKYMDSEEYLCDSWWFDDEEILNDVQNMSVIEFFAKYKI